MKRVFLFPPGRFWFMRYRIVYTIFLLTLIGLWTTSGPASAESPWSSPEQVPFPFSDRTLEEEISAGPFRQPPSAIGTASAGGVSEEGREYGQSAPNPNSVLRPRYRIPEIQPQRNLNAKQVAGTIPQNLPPTAAPTSAPLQSPRSPQFVQTPLGSPTQRAVSWPIPKFEPENDPSPAATRQASWTLPKFEPEPFDPTPSENIPLRNRNVRVGSPGHFVNDFHGGDDLTCRVADGGVSTFQHLGILKRGRGYCDACGFSNCSNKMLHQWFVDGWLTVGSTLNFDWPENKTNEPLRYNDRNGEVVLNQLYLSFGRKIDPRRNKFDVGGRIDLLYGTDYFATSSLNLETRDSRYSDPESLTLSPYEADLRWNSNTGPRRGETAALYGLSLPQAYGEVFLPYGFGTTVRAGHFYSGMSLESAMSPLNFFYSHSYSFMYGSPTTLTGMTATTQWDRRLSTIVGITQGSNVFDNPMDRVCWLAGLQWETFDKETEISFLVHSGKESERGDDVRTGYSLTLRQLLTKRLHYALEHTLGYEDNAKRINLDDRGPARWASLAQYLQWELNDQWSVGLRGEWFRDDGFSRIVNRPMDSFVYSVSGKNLYELTFGVNWKPTRFITIRPELRYDWSDTRVFNKLDGTTSGIFNGNRDMFSVAIDGIFRF